MTGSTPQCAIETGETGPARGRAGREGDHWTRQAPQTPLKSGISRCPIAHDQHAEEQFRVDRRPSDLAVEGRQVRSNPAQINEAVDRPQQMGLGDMAFERKLVEQSVLLDLPFPHYRPHSSDLDLKI